MTDPRPQSDRHFLTRRKRVVAREVNESEIEDANRHAAELLPDDILTPQVIENFEGATVVDPTTLGRRHRRSSHHRIYRWTQFCAILAAMLASVAFICAMVDELAPARACAGPGIVLGIVAIVLAGHNSLSARWRGWAIASAVFAATALGMTWLQRVVF